MHKSAPVVVCSEIKLKNFRCFESVVFNFEQPIVLLEGLNGVGKTSLLEALYYACYLKSFRTHVPKELIRFGCDNFFIKLQLSDSAAHQEIQVGFSHEKRSVKINKKNVNSYKELMSHYRVISLIEDDLALIKGGPQERRSFIDQALVLEDASFASTLKEFKTVLNNRNNLIYTMGSNANKLPSYTSPSESDNYMIWTQQLWEKSRDIQERRKALLSMLLEDVRYLITLYFGNQYTITGSYEAKKMKTEQTFASFLQENPQLIEYERRFRRSYFGAHLDDFSLLLEQRETKRLASRGQQKLLLLLLKIAQARLVVAKHGPIIFLLDDFMVDFDTTKIGQLLALLSDLGSQLIFSSPLNTSILGDYIRERGGGIITLEAPDLAPGLTHRIKGPTLDAF